jgi:hypothetical protein
LKEILDEKVAAQRDFFQEQMGQLNVTAIANDFDIEKEMKARLIRKTLIKLQDSDYTPLELKEKRYQEREVRRYRSNLHQTDHMQRHYHEPDKYTLDETQNCFLMLRVCNEDKAFLRFKQREIEKEITPSGCIVHKKPDVDEKYRRSKSPRNQRRKQSKKKVYPIKLLEPEEIDDLRENFRREEEEKILAKQRRYLRFKKQQLINMQRSGLSSKQ